MIVDALEDEDSGWWIGIVPDAPGLTIEAPTRQAALACARVLAARVQAERARDALQRAPQPAALG